MERELKITIPLRPVTKKNDQEIHRTKDGRPFIAPSNRFVNYQDQCGFFLRKYMHRTGFPIMHPVEVTCLFYRKSRQRMDLTNALEAIDDVLVHYGVLDDDNCNIIVSHDGSRVLYDKEHPRTEITIRRYKDEQHKDNDTEC